MAKQETNVILSPDYVSHPLILKIAGADVDLKNAVPIAEYAQKAIDLITQYTDYLNIKAVDHNDSTAIQLAADRKKLVKNERTSSEKWFDAKRSLVQEDMKVFSDQDKALLKIKQWYVEEAKAVEAHLDDQIKIKEKYEAEQKQKLIDKRLAILELLVDDVSVYNVGEMTEASFEALTFGIKAQKEAAEKARKEEEARIEREKELDRVFNERRFQLQKYSVIPNSSDKILSLNRETTRVEFDELVNGLDKLLTAYNNAAEIARKEMEAVKAEAERVRKEQEAAAEKLRQEQQENRKIRYGKARTMLLDNFFLPEDHGFSHTTLPFFVGYNHFNSLDSDAELEQFKSHVETQVARLKAEADALKAKQEAEEQTRKIREEQERLEKEKLAKASATITDWIDQFTSPEYIDTKNPKIEEARTEILRRFDDFKNWAKKLVNK